MLIAPLPPPVKQSRQHDNNINYLQLRSSLEVQGDVGSPRRHTSSTGLEQVEFPAALTGEGDVFAGWVYDVSRWDYYRIGRL